MNIKTLQVGDTITYSFKKVTYTGVCLKHTKKITTELINNEHILSYESNKYFIMLNTPKIIITIESNDPEVSVIDIKRRERLLI